ncbi:MAG: oligosaccharide flippase family protein [Clostridia bacterium]|nr:oligosaccharide flippase family protein [Clostridia bacterium]
MKKKEFLTGVASLSVSMLITRSTSMAFSVYVSSRLGASNMGVFHLIVSVFAFAVTVAISGIPLAVTRLISESKSKERIRSVMSKCTVLALFCGVTACAVMLISADAISVKLLKTPSTAIPIRLLALTLPLISFSSVIRGYFTGIQKVSFITASCMVEEFSSIAAVLGIMKCGINPDSAFMIPIWGTLVSSVITCVCDVVLYFLWARAKSLSKSVPVKTGEILSISMPVALGSYIRSGLVAVENMIIPIALAKSGMINGVAGYGVIKGMAMPIITFPYVFLQSLTSLLIPEVSGRYAKHNRRSVIRAAKTSIRWTFILAMAIAVFLLIYGKKLATNLYGNWEAGLYVTALSLLTIPMYIDSVTDSLLKGLNEQVYCLKINIIDSAIRVPVIYLLLPCMGIYGYIAVLYGSELMNLALSAHRLKKILVQSANT